VDACCGTRHLRLYRAPLSLPRRSPTLSFSLQLSLLSHHLLHNRRKKTRRKPPAMEKNEMPIVGASNVAAGASAAAPRPGPRRCFQHSRRCISRRRISRRPRPGPRRLGPVRTSAVCRAGEPLRHQHHRRRAGGNPLFTCSYPISIILC
jgi:hypothetical protein